MNDPTLPMKDRYVLPENQPDPWPPRWQVWLALLVMAALIGWAAGHAVGWAGQ